MNQASACTSADNAALLRHRCFKTFRDLGKHPDRGSSTTRTRSALPDHLGRHRPGPAYMAATSWLRKFAAEPALEAEDSITGGLYLSGRRSIPTPPERRNAERRKLSLVQCAANNLQEPRSPTFPSVVVGLHHRRQRSGKSTLVKSCLHPAAGAQARPQGAPSPPGSRSLRPGSSPIEQGIGFDLEPDRPHAPLQSRTYTGAFDPIPPGVLPPPWRPRPAATRWGKFSFNVKGGRCEACSGQGVKRDLR